MQKKLFGATLVAATLLAAPVAQAQVALTAKTYTQNFDTLATSGTSKALPTGWKLDERGSSTAGSDDAYATSNANTGTAYAFGTGSERALGSVTSGSATPILFGAFFTNALGGAIESLTLNYFGEQWRLGTASSERLSFEYSLDATSLSNGSWTAFNALDFVSIKNGTGSGSSSSVLDGNAAGNRADISATIGNLSIANGGGFAIRWTDRDVGGSDHGLAIDDLTLIATLAPSAVPEPAAWAMLIGGFGFAGAALRRRAKKAVFA
ncbi:PEP-CTERM protein-sorting domain-containing protein [Sphingomonas sp. NFR04]|uniref:PEPxxWA-CTERM sorting domain-containing protein n=1 Tax=Sphingomonas sp. NFR04 TaxID=1566283 RepID=UPI0008EE7D79|nr:PEPxxWA-CTERM sorting domain-containing protein [Sphingomonas sp. NFR04]SFJ89514.1 PEP-CTERM protein-sorting domain-containing protein [Sphingomonas sp. NFR04]